MSKLSDKKSIKEEKEEKEETPKKGKRGRREKNKEKGKELVIKEELKKTKGTSQDLKEIWEQIISNENPKDEEDDEEEAKEEAEAMNNFLIREEELNRKEITDKDSYPFLYPNLDDMQFNIKLSERKEFYDTRYDGTIQNKDGTPINIEENAEKLCNMEFELAPYQLFVRNFLSFQTPYNSLLLYHGVGSGKTCSAITVAEEMRDYLKQMNITQRIIVVASPNVQENFKLQLFDERKLKWSPVEGWNIRACTGKKYLKELNQQISKKIPKETIIRQVRRIIQKSYLFLGYIEFANYIKKISDPERSMDNNKNKNKKISKIGKKKLQYFFNNRLIIIDEVHNIRKTDDNKDKRVASEVEKMVKNVDNLRLLLLSATPIYNSYREIVWLINLMNMNDKRSIMNIKNVFDKDGNFKKDSSGKEVGKELLERKSIGYVSFVRGENPYTFPYRVWPKMFSPKNTFNHHVYPRQQLNGKPIVPENILKHIDVYLTNIGSYQRGGYDYIIDKLKKDSKGDSNRLPSFENMESFGYNLLQRPLEGLNIIYPDERLDEYISSKEKSDDKSKEVVPTFDAKTLVGKSGLERIMNYEESQNPPRKNNFAYKTDKYGHIFSLDEIKKYSGKIHNIGKSILNSKGIVLIYSQYIDGGLVPIALTLEEMGFHRYGKTSSLFKEPPNPTSIGSYVMITGEKILSPDNVYELKALTDSNNVNGEKIKVVLISQAGSEGLDFTNIRQVHILEPWYNMNRIEQIIGRAIRTCSHKNLPFSDRNVEIYLYGSLLDNEFEAADLYVYRLAESKAIKIGEVSRVLKKNSIDCLLNFEQMNFTEKDMNQVVLQKLSNGKQIQYPVGDKPYSSMCDYMESCNYECKSPRKLLEKNIKQYTYNESFIFMNADKIIQRIRDLMKEKYFYSKDELIKHINILKKYPLDEIDAALTQLIEEKTEYIYDKYGREGNLINIGDLYLFQPIELVNSHISLYDREVPLQYKREKIIFPISEKKSTLPITGDVSVRKKNDAIKIIKELKESYKKATTPQILNRGEEDWYKSCSLAIQELAKGDITKKISDEFIIIHMIQLLSYEDHIQLLDYLYNKEIEDTKSIEYKIKEYYEKEKMENKSKNIIGIMLQNKGLQRLVIFKNKKWIPGENEDYEDLKKNINKIVPTLSKLNNLIGFIANFKKEDYLVFKIKNIKKKRHKGARCDQSSKKELLHQMNELVDEKNKYTDKSTKDLGKKELCIIQEFTMRYFDKTKKDGKIWFLNPVQAALINIENYFADKK